MLHTSDLQVLVNDTGATLTSKPYPVQQDNNGVGNGDPETEALSYVAGATETYDQNAFIDPMLQRDIDSIKSYCARANADVIAVASGAWSDADSICDVGQAYACATALVMWYPF